LEECLKKVWGSDERVVEVGNSLDQFFTKKEEKLKSPPKKRKLSETEGKIPNLTKDDFNSSDSFIENDIPNLPETTRKISSKVPDSLVRKFILFEANEKGRNSDSSLSGSDDEVQVSNQSAPLSNKIEANPDVEALCSEIVSQTSKQLHKTDFSRMHPIGQFNKAFIVTRLDNELYLVDQHAADEKTRFEHYTENIKMTCQPLTIPLKVKLSQIEKEVVLNNRDGVFKKNKFFFQDAEKNHETVETDENQLQTTSNFLKITHFPVFEKTQLGLPEFREILNTLMDEDCPDSVKNSFQPARIRYKLASKACRSAIMIGDGLERSDMVTVVGKLAKLERPWNCPHGRPTCRHLATVEGLKEDVGIERRDEVYDGGFVFE